MPSVVERPKFLIELLAEVDAFEAVYESHDPVQADETPIGTLDPWLTRAYSLARYYTKQARLLAVEREYSDGSEFSDDPELMEMKCKAEVLMEIQWAAVSAQFNLWTAPNVGIRNNFIVIRSQKSDEEDGIKSVIKKLFGR